MKKGSLAALAVAAALTAGMALPAQAAPDQAPAQTDQYIIKFADDVAKDNAANAANTKDNAINNFVKATKKEKAGVRTMWNGAKVVTLSEAPTEADAAAAISATEGLSAVVSVEADRIDKAMATPNDPMFSEQWHYMGYDKFGIKLESALNVAAGQGQTVAVLDTGYTVHPDLDPTRLGTGVDMIWDTETSQDGDGRDMDGLDEGDTYWDDEYQMQVPSSWHGTHVAGTIAAATNNGIGVAGVAGEARHIPVRVLGTGGGYTSDIADGIAWAAGSTTVEDVTANTNPAQVINMSLGGYRVDATCDTAYQDAINFAVSRGSTVVVAAGNEDDAARNYAPANCANVIVVGASGHEGDQSSYSNYGPELLLSAPGGDQSRYQSAESGILSTLNTGESVPADPAYAWYQGTSMATPHVAGIVALMNSINYELTPADNARVLRHAVNPIKACTGGCGYGIADAAKAVTYVGGFADMPIGTAFQKEVTWFAWHNMGRGWDNADGTRQFNPALSVNRDSMAAFLYRAAGSPAFTPPADSPFSDIGPGDAFYKEVTWVHAQGIAFGWDGAANEKPQYRPTEPIARDAMAAFFYRYAEEPTFVAPETSPFVDVATDQAFYKEMAWMADEGISTGWTTDDGAEYRPGNHTGRDAMAAFFYRVAVNAQVIPVPAAG